MNLMMQLSKVRFYENIEKFIKQSLKIERENERLSF